MEIKESNSRGLIGATKMQEDVKDGLRFSKDVKEVRGKIPKKMQDMRDKVLNAAIETGYVDPDDLTGAEETPAKKATRIVAKSLGMDKLQHLNGVTDDDIEFINNLPDDGSRDRTIKQLFGAVAAKSMLSRLPKQKEVQPVKTRNMEKFVRLYIENYDKALEGKPYRNLRELTVAAGYSKTVPSTSVVRVPWVAKQLEDYHKSIEQINEYHYRQIDDRKQRLKARLMDLNDRVVDQHLADPMKLSKASIRDQATFLKMMNEMVAEKEKSRGPTIAIQMNADTLKLAESQDSEKRNHLEASFE